MQYKVVYCTHTVHSGQSADGELFSDKVSSKCMYMACVWQAEAGAKKIHLPRVVWKV